MNEDRDDSGEFIPDLVKDFLTDPERFLNSESSRATPLGQVWCRCEDPAHSVHQPRECGRDAFKEGYCRDCFTFRKGSTAAGV